MTTPTTMDPELAEGEPQDVSRAMNAVRGIVRALRLNTRAIELKMGISLAQLFVLQQLAEQPADSLNDLATRTATHQSSVSVVVKRLVDAGLATRRAASSDRRRVQIEVTDAGRERLRGAPETVQAQLITSLQRMPADQRRLLADLLERWVGGAGFDFENAPMMFEGDSEDR